jgi:peptide/nickel transport system ATP-binding protein
VRLDPPRGRSADDMVSSSSGSRSEAPDEPFWKGVRRLEAVGGRLELDFHEPHDPKLRRSGDVEVACHLFNPPA